MNLDGINLRKTRNTRNKLNSENFYLLLTKFIFFIGKLYMSSTYKLIISLDLPHCKWSEIRVGRISHSINGHSYCQQIFEINFDMCKIVCLNFCCIIFMRIPLSGEHEDVQDIGYHSENGQRREHEDDHNVIEPRIKL